MPIAQSIWFETLRPQEKPSLVAAFDTSQQTADDPARMGDAFVMEVEGLGDVEFHFVACIKGRSIFAAKHPDQECSRGHSPERAQLFCQELLTGVA